MNVEELMLQLSSAQSLAEERLDLLMHCRADLDNVMKRSAREKEDNVKYASEKLVSKLLPVLDSLDVAAKHDEGSKVLYMQLLDILSGEGLMPIEAKGVRFDPYRHEALFQVRRKSWKKASWQKRYRKATSLTIMSFASQRLQWRKDE